MSARTTPRPGGDAAFGDEGELAGEELADVRTGGELGEFGEKVSGEVFRVGLDWKGNGAVRMGVGVHESVWRRASFYS
jgi:hypothetical protein